MTECQDGRNPTPQLSGYHASLAGPGDLGGRSYLTDLRFDGLEKETNLSVRQVRGCIVDLQPNHI